MIIRTEGDMAVCRCNIKGCVNEFNITMPLGNDDYSRIVRSYIEIVNCDPCVEAIKAKEDAYKLEQRKLELPEMLQAAGVPETFRVIGEPYNRKLAEWVWKNRFHNLRIGGDTGRGKTGAMCNALAHLALKGYKVKYRTCRELIAGYAKGKAVSEKCESFLNGLYACDVLAVDEFVGKAKLTETGAECLFEIIDHAYSFNSPKIWISGQFFKGSILKMFGDTDTEEAIQRRFDERFLTNLDD